MHESRANMKARLLRENQRLKQRVKALERGYEMQVAINNRLEKENQDLCDRVVRSENLKASGRFVWNQTEEAK